MILGLLIMAIVAALAVSVLLFLLSAPIWLVLLAYPVTGAAVLLSGTVLRSPRLRQWTRGNKRTVLSRVTARFRAGQPPR